MAALSYFTLPIGHPVCGSEVVVPAENEHVYDVLASADPEGAYQLYQCVFDDGHITNAVTVCTVRKPLLSTLPKVYLDTSSISTYSKMTRQRKQKSQENFGSQLRSTNFSSTYQM